MDEFIRRKIDKKLKINEYIIKSNKWLGLSSFITIVLIVLYIFICISISINDVTLTSTNDMLLMVLNAMTLISALLSCYLWGKRNGAIEQFKSTLKPENEQ